MMLNGIEAWWPPSGFTVELAPAGHAWDAVRVPSEIGLPVVARLGDDSGAVIQDVSGGILYWLVRPGAADAWKLPQPFVEIRGETSYVAVPPVGRITGEHRLWWIVPLTRSSYLTDPELLHAALAAEIETVAGSRPDPLPCGPCLTAKIFDGRHDDCEGTTVMGHFCMEMTPIPATACPCGHVNPEADS
jgi:hypothetical protein